MTLEQFYEKRQSKQLEETKNYVAFYRKRSLICSSTHLYSTVMRIFYVCDKGLEEIL